MILPANYHQSSSIPNPLHPTPSIPIPSTPPTPSIPNPRSPRRESAHGVPSHQQDPSASRLHRAREDGEVFAAATKRAVERWNGGTLRALDEGCEKRSRFLGVSMP